MSDKIGQKPINNEDVSREIRESLGLEPGMFLTIEVTDTSIRVVPKKPYSMFHVFMMLQAAMAAVDVAAEREAAAVASATKH